MMRYKMEMLVQLDGPDGPHGEEKLLKCNVTTTDELSARRLALQRAWIHSPPLVVVGFTQISSKEDKLC
jgi:hypothetical protein